MPDCSLQRANRLKDMFSLYKSISNLCLLFNSILIFFLSLALNLTHSQISKKLPCIWNRHGANNEASLTSQ